MKASFKAFFTAATAIIGLMMIIGCTRPSPEKRAEWITKKIDSTLDLNKDQRAKLDAVKDTVLEVRKEHAGDKEKNLAQLKTLLLSEKMDAAQVKSLIQERQKFMDKNFDRVFAKFQDFHASLDAKQKQKAVDVLSRFMNYE